MKIFVANFSSKEPLDQGKERFFIKAGSRWPFSITKKSESRFTDYMPFPFYLAYTTALLVQNKFDVETLDAVALNSTNEEQIKKVCDFSPDLLLLETTTPTFLADYAICQELKKRLPKLLICLSGPHITSFADQIVKDYPAADYLIRGEYEFAFLELARAIERGERSPTQIPGLCFEGHFSDKALLEDLNDLPFPAWDYFPYRGVKDPWSFYWDNICQSRKSAQMHFSRGCPFRCDFCVWIQVTYNNSKVRAFSSERVIREMKELKSRYGIQEVYFDDDNFTANGKAVDDFCAKLKESDLKMHWSAMGDAMTASPELIRTMHSAGLVGYKFGVESGDESVLKEIRKPVKIDKLFKIVQECRTLKVKTHATYSFGLSGDTEGSMEKTLELAKKLPTDSVQFSISTPYPGTQFFQKTFGEIQVTPKEWKYFDGTSAKYLNRKTASLEQVNSIYNRAFKEWFFFRAADPVWLWRQIRTYVFKLNFRVMFTVLRRFGLLPQ